MNTNTPNVLLIMVDQMAAPAMPVYRPINVKIPNIEVLAARSVVFENAYCNFPICAPSRFSMLAGRLPTAIDAFDNASEFSAATPTLAHYLGYLGYATTLCGKMHFIGPDQFHGYQERLTTDVYPSDFAWTPDWSEGERNKPSGVSMRSVVEAGMCVRSLQIDYDEEVEHYALQKIFDLARAPDKRPFFLTISFAHPHPPFVIEREFWDRYADEEIEMPQVPAIPAKNLDPYSRWLHIAHGGDLHTVTDDHVRRARRAYFGMMSYIDDKIGRIMDALDAAELTESTLVVFAGDHGEMLGERGMWYKQTFFEWSARVPLFISYPGKISPGRRPQVVSLVDLVPTLLDFATDGRPPESADPFDGNSMRKLLLDGDDPAWPDTAISEYTAEGVRGPCRMIRRGRYKYVYTHGHDAMLFDLEADPLELSNLAGKPGTVDVEIELAARLAERWDADQVMARVMASQRRRRLVQQANKKGGATNWAFVARPGDERRFVRDAGAVVEAKARSRFPYVAPVPPDRA